MYDVFVAADANFSNVLFRRVDYTGTLFAVSGLDYNKQFYWKVRPLNTHCSRDWSNVYTYKIGFPAFVSVKSDNEAINLSVKVDFEWQSIQNAQSYFFEFSASRDFSKIDFSKNLSGTKLTVKDIDNATVYYWRVKAFDDKLHSEWS